MQGGNDTNDPSARSDIAAEIDQLTEAVKQEANTKYGDQYIFGGTANATAPYQAGAVDTYGGNSAAISREVGPGASVQVNTDISQLLGSGQAAADGKLLNTLRDISQHLRGGTAADANALRGTDLQNIDSNLDTLTTLQANVGSTLNRLDPRVIANPGSPGQPDQAPVADPGCRFRAGSDRFFDPANCI